MDFEKIFREHQGQLPSEPDANAQMKFSVMADGLYWTDEGFGSMEWALDNALRRVLNYRKFLLTEQGSGRYQYEYELARKYFPSWVGFRKERCTLNLEIAQRYKRIKAVSNRKIDRFFEAAASEPGPKVQLNRQAVAAVFESYPKETREKLLVLRQLILETAAETKGVGDLEECLRWGQPSYVTAKTKSGSTVRIDRLKRGFGDYAMFFNCRTKLVETFRKMFPTQLNFAGNRAIVFEKNEEIPVEELKICIAMAQTYHLDKKPKQ